MELNPADLVIHLINIVILYLLMRAFVYKPVLRFMRQRDERIAGQFEKAETMMQEAQGAQQDSALQLKEAQDKALETIRTGEKKAALQAQTIVEQANIQAQRMKEDALAELDAERQRTMRSMQKDIAQLATDMAGQILRREVRLEDNQSLVEDFFEQAEVSHGKSNS